MKDNVYSFPNKEEALKNSQVEISWIATKNGGKVKRTLNVEKRFLTAATAIVIVASGMFGSAISDVFKEANTQTDGELYEKETKITIFADNAVWHSPTDKDLYGYNHDVIANAIQRQEYPDDALYVAYLNMKGRENLDEVVHYLSNEFSTFDDYLRANGFVNKDGNVDEKEYGKTMDRILDIHAEIKKNKSELSAAERSEETGPQIKAGIVSNNGEDSMGEK